MKAPRICLNNYNARCRATIMATIIRFHRVAIGFALFYCAIATSSENTAAPPDFSKPWKCSDVVLVVEDQKFHVHRYTLAMWSPGMGKEGYDEDFASSKRKTKLKSRVQCPKWRQNG